MVKFALLLLLGMVQLPAMATDSLVSISDTVMKLMEQPDGRHRVLLKGHAGVYYAPARSEFLPALKKSGESDRSVEIRVDPTTREIHSVSSVR